MPVASPSMSLRWGVAALGVVLIAAAGRSAGTPASEPAICSSCRMDAGASGLTCVLVDDDQRDLCQVCVARAVRQRSVGFGTVVRMAIGAVMGVFVLALSARILASSPSKVDPDESFGEMVGRSVALLDPFQASDEVMLGVFAVVSAIAIATAVTMERLMDRADRVAQRAARARRQAALDLHAERELLRIEHFALLQLFVVLVLSLLCGALGIAALRDNGRAYVGLIGLVLALWMFVELLRLERVTRVAERARAVTVAGAQIVLGRRRRDVELTSPVRSWSSGVTIVSATGLAALVGTGMDASLGTAVTLGAAVGVLGLVLAATLFLTTEVRWPALTLALLLALAWTLSVADVILGVAEPPSVGVALGSIAVVLVVWFVATLGAVGLGPLRSIARFALWPATWVDKLDGWSDRARRGSARTGQGGQVYPR